MPLVSKSIPNLLNGVSQQSPIVRRESQLDEQINAISHPIIGTGKRPPTHHVAKLLNSVPARTFRHTISRDTEERYIVLIADGQIVVYDIVNDTFPTVSYPNGTGYLADAGNGFSAVTAKDVTFIANRNTTVSMLPATTPTRLPEAMVACLAGNYSKTYRIFINGSAFVSYTTRDSSDVAHEGDIATTNIVAQLRNTINALGTNITASVYGSDLYIRSNSGADFSISTADGNGGRDLVASKGVTDNFADLPLETAPGVKIKILGDRDAEADDYYVEFGPGDGGLAKSRWNETVAPGTPTSLDASTMPHTLTREADGTFTFAQASWGGRSVGDEGSNPDPSFVGERINHVFFHRNRFGVLAGENVILSRGDRQYFDFFRETVITSLATDPIDVTSPGKDVAILLDTVPYNEDLVVRSGKSQFVLRGEPLFTPSEVTLRPRSRYESDPNSELVVIGNKAVGDKVYLPFTRGSYAGLWELSITSDTATNVADDITEHVPNYIPGTFTKIAASAVERIMVGLTDAAPSTIFVYQFLWGSDGARLQAAWHRWDLDPGKRVLDVEFIQSDLFITFETSDGIYVDRLRISPKQRDPGSTFVYHVDRRLDETEIVSGPTYDAVTDTSTFTLPYLPSASSVLILRADHNGAPAGSIVNHTDLGGSVCQVSGDFSGAQFYFGTPYSTLIRLSTIYLREDKGSSSTALTEGRLQLSSVTVIFAESGYFEVKVTPSRRPTRTKTYTGKTLGTLSALLGQISVEEQGNFRAGVNAQNTQVEIEITSDNFLPFNVTGLDWEGNYHLRSRRT